MPPGKLVVCEHTQKETAEKAVLWILTAPHSSSCILGRSATEQQPYSEWQSQRKELGGAGLQTWERHPRLLPIKFGFHQLHKTQSSSQPGPKMEKGRSVERQRARPPEPAVTGPTREVSSSNKYRLFTYTTSNNVLPPGLAQLHSLSTGSQARG